MVAIYVHVPFCEQKCHYCDFFTVTDPRGEHPLAGRWMDLCWRELELWAAAGDVQRARDDGPRVSSIFFGGGTPSLLQPDQIGNFLAHVHREIGLSADAEITLETQPRTVDREKLHAFAEAGVTRFSIGVQTFNESLLAKTGRRYSVADTRNVIENAITTGRVVSLDLIAALPGQSPNEWRWELDQALEYVNRAPAATSQLTTGVGHISVYELTFHSGTRWHRDLRAGRLSEADEDARIAMFQETGAILTTAGFDHYEISNYALPGMRSHHNETYWTLGDYVGLGAGAHGLVWPHRWSNPPNAAEYARAIDSGNLPRVASDPGDPEVFLIENLAMVLRLNEGFDLDRFAAKLGTDLRNGRYGGRLERLISLGQLELDGPRLRMTPAGRLRADSVIEGFL